MTKLRDVGPYRIDELLGEGGMGAVYRGFDTRLRRHIALKRPHPFREKSSEARLRFLREARMAAGLNDPALVQVHDIVETEDADWIVMELVEGTPLSEVTSVGPLAVDRALSIALQVTRGLAAAHAKGVLHRDLKSENVMLTDGGKVKILDFGLGRCLFADSLTNEGQFLGTPRVASPEQAQGWAVDERSDLFSLGVLLYEMLTATSPFLASGASETLARVCCFEPEPVRDHDTTVPIELSELVDQLLAKDRELRPKNAEDVARILEHMTDKRDLARSLEELPTVDRSVPRSSLKGFRLQGEQRQLTLLSCELTGLPLDDPELLFKVLPGFQRLVQEAVRRYEGYLYDVQGHRLVALFGYPAAHEDNVRRALLAGREITAAVSSSQTLDGWAARVGVQTGLGVITEDGQLVPGAILDAASQLRESASPGQVLADSTTSSLVESPSIRNGFVGRRQELALVADRFSLACEGEGQAVLVVGEGGIGKTRFLEEFRASLGPEVCWIRTAGSPYARHQLFRPLDTLLRNLLALDGQASHGVQLQQLSSALEEGGLDPREALPLFAALLSLPAPDVETLGLDSLRRQALEVIPALVGEIAGRRPSVLAFEDIHLMDTATMELIGQLVEQVPAFASLLVLTSRSELRVSWTQHTQLPLAPLTEREVDELIDHLTVGHRLTDSVRTDIASRADGLPRFVEELVRAAGEEQVLSTVPMTLRDECTALLDRLGDARDVALAAAVLSEDCSVSLEMLAGVLELDPIELEETIDNLLELGIFQRKGQSYAFRRVLVREAASATLLPEDRERLYQLASRARLSGRRS